MWGIAARRRRLTPNSKPSPKSPALTPLTTDLKNPLACSLAPLMVAASISSAVCRHLPPFATQSRASRRRKELEPSSERKLAQSSWSTDSRGGDFQRRVRRLLTPSCRLGDYLLQLCERSSGRERCLGGLRRAANGARFEGLSGGWRPALASGGTQSEKARKTLRAVKGW